MDYKRRNNIEALKKKSLFADDWFVCGKKIWFRAGRDKKIALLDRRMDKRILDKPEIKTVFWSNI